MPCGCNAFDVFVFQKLDRRDQPVAFFWNGFDIAGVVGVVFKSRAQAVNSLIDSIVPDDSLAPHFRRQLVRRDYPTGVAGQIDQHSHGRRLDRLAATVPLYAVERGRHRPLTDSELVRFRIGDHRKPVFPGNPKYSSPGGP